MAFFVPPGVTTPLLSHYLTSQLGVLASSAPQGAMMLGPNPSVPYLSLPTAATQFQPTSVGALPTMVPNLSTAQQLNALSGIGLPLASFYNPALTARSLQPSASMLATPIVVSAATTHNAHLPNGSLNNDAGLISMNTSVQSSQSIPLMVFPRSGTPASKPSEAENHVIVGKPVKYPHQTSGEETPSQQSTPPVTAGKKRRAMAAPNKEAVMNKALQELLATGDSLSSFGYMETPPLAAESTAPQRSSHSTPDARSISRSSSSPVCARVPMGWRRTVMRSTRSVTYISPSNEHIGHVESLRCYLQDATSCKCGLPQGASLEEWMRGFCFDAEVICTLVEDEPGNREDLLCDVCLRKRGNSLPFSRPENQTDMEVPSKRVKLDSKAEMKDGGGDDMDICEDEMVEDGSSQEPANDTDAHAESDTNLVHTEADETMRGDPSGLYSQAQTPLSVVTSQMGASSASLAHLFPANTGLYQAYNPAAMTAVSLSPYTLSNFTHPAVNTLAGVNSPLLPYSLSQQNAAALYGLSQQQTLLNSLSTYPASANAAAAAAMFPSVSSPGFLGLSAGGASAHLLNSLLQQQKMQQNLAILLHQQQQQQQLAQLTAALLSSSSSATSPHSTMAVAAAAPPPPPAAVASTTSSASPPVSSSPVDTVIAVTSVCSPQPPS